MRSEACVFWNRSSGRAVCGVGAVCAKDLGCEEAAVLEDGGQRIWTAEGQETWGVGLWRLTQEQGEVWN